MRTRLDIYFIPFEFLLDFFHQIFSRIQQTVFPFHLFNQKLFKPFFHHYVLTQTDNRIFSWHLYSKFFEIFFLVEYSNSIIMQFEPFSYNFLRLSNF